MDERAQNLRLLMKQQQHNSSNQSSSANLSGKDKAKLLKMMKAGQTTNSSNHTQQQHQKSTSSSSSRQPSQASASASASAIESKSSSKSVPKGFYDDEEEVPSFPVPAKSSAPSTKSSSNNHQISNNGSSSTTALPVGFYDDPEEDMVAHGISKQAFEVEKEKVITEDLSLFLGEIEQISDITGQEEAVEAEQQSNLQEDEESALQMAYMLKLAALYKKSTTTERGNVRDKISSLEDPSIDQFLAEAEEISALVKVDDTGPTRVLSDTSALHQVEHIMRQKRQLPAVDPYATSSHLHKRIRTVCDTAAADDTATKTPQKEQPTTADSEEEEEDEEEEEEEYDPLAFF